MRRDQLPLTRRIAVVAAALLLVARAGSAALPDEPPPVRIHYLGHAAFVLQFGHALTVVTDLETRVLLLEPAPWRD